MEHVELISDNLRVVRLTLSLPLIHLELLSTRAIEMYKMSEK